MNQEQMARVIREGWPKSDLNITAEQADLAALRIMNWYAENGDD